MSSILRTAKYSVKGYNSVQAKVRDATSNDPQPPTGSQLNELSQLSYNPDYFQEIVIVLGKRLDDKGRNWRHVYKSLVVLDYLLHSGSEAVVLYFQKNVYIIKTLKEFQYVDEEGKDQGANIRIKATDIANLLIDDTRLRQIRRNRAEMRDRMLGRLPRQDSLTVNEDMENENVQRRSMLLIPGGDDEDAVRLQSARAQIRLAREMEDKDLMRAFKMGQPDDDKQANPPSPAPLFEEPAPISTSTSTTPTATTPSVSAPVSPPSNELSPLVVFDGMDQMTPQPPPQIMPQYTSFNPFFNMQTQQDMFQAEQLRQQQEWLRIQAAQQQLQQQQEEWLRQQMLHQQQQQALQQQQQQPFFQISTEPSLFQPQASPFQIQTQAPTPVARSNNPFAPSPSFSVTPTQASSLPSPTSSSPSPILLTPSSPEPPVNVLTSTQPMRKNSPFNTQHRDLDQLFANRDDAGMDTFGNVGQLRYGHNFIHPSA